MKIAKKTFVLVLMSLLVVSLFGVFVLADYEVVSSAKAHCNTEGMMDCRINADGTCEQQTCRDHNWGPWTAIGKDYKCATAPHGGQRCFYNKKGIRNEFQHIFSNIEQRIPFE